MRDVLQSSEWTLLSRADPLVLARLAKPLLAALERGHQLKVRKVLATPIRDDVAEVLNMLPLLPRHVMS